MIKTIHFFDTEVAKEYGMDCAVLFQNIGYWVEHNRDNEQNYFDGYYWTYNSTKAFESFFPYMSYQKIGRALTKLEEVGLIKSGIYNRSPFDRTKWYTLTETGYAIFKNDNSHLSNLINGDITGDKPIPYINTNNKQIKKHTTVNPKDVSGQDGSAVSLKGHDLNVATVNGFAEDDGLLNAYIDFFKMRKSIKKPLTDRAVSMLKSKLEELAPGDVQKKIAILNQSSFHCWQGVFELKDGNPVDDTVQKQVAVSGGQYEYDIYGNRRQ